MTTPYPPETLHEDDDDGTMPENVAALSENVVGHRIVGVDTALVPQWEGSSWTSPATIITLDNGKRVALVDTDDCCAFTELEAFLLHPERVGHVITGVGTTDGFTQWHIFADLGDVLELTVSGYGFDIRVEEIPTEAVAR